MLVAHAGAPQRGFTLIELMVTVVVLTVVLLITVPSFQNFIATQRVRNASYDLVSALLLARSQAIARNGRVSVGPPQNADDWGDGWIVQDAADGDADDEDAPNVYASQGALPGVAISANIDNLKRVTYGNDGRLADAGASDVTFTFTMTGADPRCVWVGLSGLPSSAKIAGDATC